MAGIRPLSASPSMAPKFSIHEDPIESAALSECVEEASNPATHRATKVRLDTVPLVSAKLSNLRAVREGITLEEENLTVDALKAAREADAESPATGELLPRFLDPCAVQETNVTSSKEHVSDPIKLATSGGQIPNPSRIRFTETLEDIEARNDDTNLAEVIEMDRLRKELDAAKNKIAWQEQELSQVRLWKHAIEHVRPDPCISDTTGKEKDGTKTYPECTEPPAAFSKLPGGCFHDDSRSDISEPMQGGNISHRFPNIGQNCTVPQSPLINVPSQVQLWAQSNAWNPRPVVIPTVPVAPHHLQQQQMRASSGMISQAAGGNNRVTSSSNRYSNDAQTRCGSALNPRSEAATFGARSLNWDSYDSGDEHCAFSNVESSLLSQSGGGFQPAVAQRPRSIRTSLSPTAAEFTSGNAGNGPWNSTPTSAQTYISPMEPLNYRRLLDRSVSCNWKYIVDKIVCNNDQQASIFLQQKLKVGTVEQKFEIVDAIVAQAYPLMVNRFGNFLVQRCFEHGTPDQIVSIANAIRGNTLSLSMDPFGCHVVQKAFDAVPEEYKAIMTHELLRRIPETVIHRYACHVWQKLFELRWSDSPPQIMKYVNEALRGMWHEVALGETGSLVVQNIFENCLDEDKRPCIDEVLQSIDIVAHGQFGNWCIQHICEHGAPADRSKAIDHVLRYATEYSMDQFASKVVEKCLKIGGNDFLGRYLDRVCEGRPDRPRIPLIDISSDQYGNYLIQYILTHAGSQHREVVASHIRKHMVSLRGSKFGSRVGLLCCNPAYATRPGPMSSSSASRFNGSNPNNPSGFSRFGYR